MTPPSFSAIRKGVVLVLILLVMVLSINPIINLLHSNQRMNTGFEPFRIVNTYGAFGSIGRTRHDLIVKGTRDLIVNENTEWKEYDFKAKPGPINETPPWVSPYHYRLDWQMWFAAMSSPNHHPWILNLTWKLLNSDSNVLTLIESNPFPRKPPRYIKIDRYRYEFTEPGEEQSPTWTRTREGEWLGPISKTNSQFRSILRRQGWID